MQRFKSKTLKENRNGRAALDLLGGGREETGATVEPYKISQEGEEI